MSGVGSDVLPVSWMRIAAAEVGGRAGADRPGVGDGVVPVKGVVAWKPPLLKVIGPVPKPWLLAIVTIVAAVPLSVVPPV